ncbi:MAG: Putative transmembrane lipoprotein [uncultured Paraburkholderia sp.]|nr:MAG: Putative transmembrane lipoprotein [uncultured Paraburkholderia sp.]CAH2794982.1 MAG: Putative transmembrane lipoprotein [uncultured Paraburkholderia sp.]CAH2930276.1 MAG: Putative transmembrane lipoprotein [uncultured Paraburkholderia sp.]
MKTNSWTRRAMLLLAALTALLSGCTTYVTTQVTAFSDWSGSDATRTYAFTREPEQRNNLELSTYERIVANELATHAFRQVDRNEARYLVGLSYGIRSDMVTVAEPVYYTPYWGWGRPFDPWGPWGPFPAGYGNQSYPIFTHLLGVRITERATGKEVYNVSARNSGTESLLVRAMPYLARSALADFPLGNGVVRTVKIPLDRNGGTSNETAVPAAAAASAPVAAPGAKAVQ